MKWTDRIKSTAGLDCADAENITLRRRQKPFRDRRRCPDISKRGDCRTARKIDLNEWTSLSMIYCVQKLVRIVQYMLRLQKREATVCARGGLWKSLSFLLQHSWNAFPFLHGAQPYVACLPPKAKFLPDFPFFWQNSATASSDGFSRTSTQLWHWKNIWFINI